MKKMTKELLVGALVLLVIAVMLVFGWLMGTFRPFSSEVSYPILYSFAGVKISRFPFDCMLDTIPARSICSMSRAARL